MRKIPIFGILILGLILAGCTVDLEEGELIEWKTIDANGLFNFKVPESLKDLGAQGIDSFVGRYSGDGILVSFDYGWYSNSLTGFGNEKGYLAWDENHKINGLGARVIEYEKDGKYYIAAHFRNIPGNEPQENDYFDVAPEGVSRNTLTLSVEYKNPEDHDLAVGIIESITFPQQ